MSAENPLKGEATFQVSEEDLTLNIDPGGEQSHDNPESASQPSKRPELKAKAPGAHSASESSQELLAKAKEIESSHDSAQLHLKQSSNASSSSSASSPHQGVASQSVPKPREEESFVPPRPPHESGSVMPINPRDYIMPDFRHALSTTPLGSIVPQLNNVVIARSDESIASVFEKLIDHKILSVPMLNLETNQYVAFLDLLDILAYLIDTMGLQSKTNWPLVEHWMAQRQMQVSCMQLVRRSNRNQWYVIASDQPLDVAIQQMAKYNVHRLAVSDLQNNFVSVLTQSHIVNWLAEALNTKTSGFGPLASLTMQDLKLGFQPVVTIQEDRIALEALLKIHQHGISGIAVVNKYHRLSGAISVSDLKDIGSTATMFTRLFMTVGEFIQNKLNGADHRFAYYVTRDDTVRTVLDLMRKYKIHRVFVVNNAAECKLVGVVSTNDILELFGTVAD